jgi:hypothetical protein
MKLNSISLLKVKLPSRKKKFFTNFFRFQINAFVCKGDACSKKTYNLDVEIKKGNEKKVEHSLKVSF